VTGPAFTRQAGFQGLRRDPLEEERTCTEAREAETPTRALRIRRGGRSSLHLPKLEPSLAEALGGGAVFVDLPAGR
jgi:hypothetical protein